MCLPQWVKKLYTLSKYFYHFAGFPSIEYYLRYSDTPLSAIYGTTITSCYREDHKDIWCHYRANPVYSRRSWRYPRSKYAELSEEYDKGNTQKDRDALENCRIPEGDLLLCWSASSYRSNPSGERLLPKSSPTCLRPEADRYARFYSSILSSVYSLESNRKGSRNWR